MSGQQKTLHLRIEAAGDASADQLTRIRAFTLAEIPAEQLYVRTFALAHNAIDRDNEAFDSSLLSDFARTLPGKSLFVRHPAGWDGDSGPGFGRFFEADILRMSVAEARTFLGEPDLQWPPGVNTAEILMGGAYTVRSPGKAEMISDIDAGIATFVSIGFNAKRGDYHRDEQGREMQSRSLTSPGEALEGSLVWLGAQPGARAIKGASRNEDITVDPKDKEQLDAANAKAAEFETKYNAAAASHNLILKAREALGEDGKLIDDPAALAAAVNAGKAHRTALVDEIVAGERAAGLCGDTDEAVAAAKSIYAGSSLEALETRAKQIREKGAKGGRVVPTQPGAPSNKGAANDEDNKGVPAVFAGALIG